MGTGKALKKMEAVDFLTLILLFFSKQGKEEVSLGEIHESVEEIQKSMPLGYSFSEPLRYSVDLLLDLEKLRYLGYASEVIYRHDAFLPKTFIMLTMLGRGHANKAVAELPDDLVRLINEAIAVSIKNYGNRWRLWAR